MSHTPDSAKLLANREAQKSLVRKVLGELYPEMTPVQAQHIQMLVRGRPELATEKMVDILGWSMVFHGVSIGKWFAELVDNYGLERVYLAVECMYDNALHKNAEHNYEQYLMPTLEAVLEQLERLARLDVLPEDAEDFAALLEATKGWKHLPYLTDELLIALLDDELDFTDLLLVDADDLSQGFYARTPLKGDRLRFSAYMSDVDSEEDGPVSAPASATEGAIALLEEDYEGEGDE